METEIEIQGQDFFKKGGEEPAAEPKKVFFLDKPDIILLILAILVSAGLVFVRPLLSNWFSKPKKGVSEVNQTPTIFPSSSIITASPEKDSFVLLRKTSQGKVRVYDFKKDSSQSMSGTYCFARWGDFIFYTQLEKVFKYNLKTGEEKVVLEVEGEKCSDMTVINDKLYISVYRYQERYFGSVFGLDLLTENKSQLLLETKGEPRIKKMGSHHVVYSFTGCDACGSCDDLYLFNPLKEGFISFVSITTCPEQKGEFYLALDNKERMIFGLYYYPDSSSFGPTGDRIYTEIQAIALDEPLIRKVLIPPQKMPEEIIEVEYLNEDNKLILIGKGAIYILDLDSDDLSKIGDLEGELLSPMVFLKQKNKFCLRDGNLYSDFKGSYEIDLVSKQIIKDSLDCLAISPTPSSRIEESYVKEAERQIDQLNLGSDYEIVEE